MIVPVLPAAVRSVEDQFRLYLLGKDIKKTLGL